MPEQHPDAPAIHGVSNATAGNHRSSHFAHPNQPCIPAYNQHDIVRRAARQPKERRLQISGNNSMSWSISHTDQISPLVARQVDKADHFRTLGADLVPRHLFPLCCRKMLDVDAGSVTGRYHRIAFWRESQNLESSSVRKEMSRRTLTSIPTLAVRPVSTSCL